VNISSNISSIHTQQSYLNSSARNIANTTKEMSSQDQNDITKDISDLISIEKNVAANVSAIKTQDDMFGSLLDITV
jgi:flagellar basal body rod protein FlgC